MSEALERRQPAKRLEAAIGVSFTVNDGPANQAETINFTYRTVAIRTDADVSHNDTIVVTIENFPPLKGNVVRIFEDGFAIRLDEISLSLVTHAQAEDLVEIPSSNSEDRIISPIVRVKGPLPAWARITSNTAPNSSAHRHYVTLISTGEFQLANLRNVWISMNQTRWIARVQRARQRGRQSIVVVILNDWQLQVASEYGVSISLVCNAFEQSCFDLDAMNIAEHCKVLMPEIDALTA